MTHVPASNTPDCFSEFIGQKVVGALFGALPVNRKDLSRWPQSLTLFSAAGSLIILPSDQEWDDEGRTNSLPQDAPLAHIYGIPNDGGDPW
jgi:hypothetical protein